MKSKFSACPNSVTLQEGARGAQHGSKNPKGGCSYVERFRLSPCGATSSLREIEVEPAPSLHISRDVTRIENGQREEVPVLEEAEAFRALHVDHQRPVEEIAAKTGKSAAHIRNRLQLCVLPEAARKAVTDGTLLVSVAYLVARLPEYVLDAATSTVLAGVAYSNQPMPLATARRLLEQKFTLRLADAPFSRTDADLVPEAGPCSTCPKRTGNQAEMFGEAATEDLCTDAACFNNKKQKLWQLKVAKAKEDGQEVMTKKDSKAAFGYGGDVQSGKLVDVTSKCESDPKGRTFKKLLGKKMPAVTVVCDPAGRAREFVKREDLVKALKEAGHEVKVAKPLTTQRSEPHDYRAEQERREKQRKVTVETVRLALGAVVEKWEEKEPTLALWRFIAFTLLCNSQGDVIERRGEQLANLNDADANQKLLAKLSEGQLRALVLELAFEGDVYRSWNGPAEALVGLCAAMKLDLKGFERDAKKNVAAVEKEALKKEAEEQAGKKGAAEKADDSTAGSGV
jgi:hypothetical protein